MKPNRPNSILTWLQILSRDRPNLTITRPHVLYMPIISDIEYEFSLFVSTFPCRLTLPRSPAGRCIVDLAQGQPRGRALANPRCGAGAYLASLERFRGTSIPRTTCYVSQGDPSSGRCPIVPIALSAPIRRCPIGVWVSCARSGGERGGKGCTVSGWRRREAAGRDGLRKGGIKQTSYILFVPASPRNCLVSPRKLRPGPGSRSEIGDDGLAID